MSTDPPDQHGMTHRCAPLAAKDRVARGGRDGESASCQRGFHSFTGQELMGVTSEKEIEEPMSTEQWRSPSQPAGLPKVGHFTTEEWPWVALQRHCGEGTDPLFITGEIVFFLSGDRFTLALRLYG